MPWAVATRLMMGSSVTSKSRRYSTRAMDRDGRIALPSVVSKSLGHASNIRWPPRNVVEVGEEASRTSREKTPPHLLVSQPRGVEFGAVAVEIDSFPDSIRARDDPRGDCTRSIAAAAASNGVPIDVVYRLVRAGPETLLKLDRRPHVQKKDDLCARRPSRKVRRLS
jgi:hypothetical protein